MALSEFSIVLRELRQRASAPGVKRREALAQVAAVLALKLQVDEVRILLRDQNESSPQFDEVGSATVEDRALLSGTRDGVKVADVPLRTALVAHDSGRSGLPAGLSTALLRGGIRSWCCVPVYAAEALHAPDAPVIGAIECRRTARYARWSSAEILLLEQCAEILADLAVRRANSSANHNGRLPADEFSSNRPRYSWIARYGNLLVLRTDAQLRVKEVIGDCQAALGVTAEELMSARVPWRTLIHRGDFKRLLRKLKKLLRNPSPGEIGELREEVRIVRPDGEGEHWFMFRAAPLCNDEGRVTGWEGFGVDISERRSAQEEAERQRRRIEALYEVSRSLQVHTDPAVVTLKGLRALLRATGSDCGLGCFYDRDSDTLEMVAVEGLSNDYVSAMQTKISGQTLIRSAIETRRGMLIRNIQTQPRALFDIVQREGLKSTILMPMVNDDVAYGGLVLYRREERPYSEADFDLVAAASSQICLAARQAEHYVAEKRQADSIAALYRLSHELSKHVSPREVAEHAFPLINQEIACKRMWLGIINEQGTHIVGQAGTGPGIRRRVVDIQIELYLRHDFLDQAIRKRVPIVVPAGTPMECSGLNRVMARIKPGTLVVVPLVALGQVIGVLVVEPVLPSPFYAKSRIGLLSSMAREIATVMIARRFEAKMADADKMRMAAMLSSGVAHNFNNLLQAVMGQASLLEMQLPRDSPLSHSARMIVDAAGRGAGLVSQLLSFSGNEQRRKTPLKLSQLLRDAKDLYNSLLGGEITLEIEAPDDIPEVLADQVQLQQVLTNLLVNAREALVGRTDGQVELHASSVTIQSAEVDPELSPGKYVRVDVRDNGPGMDSERLARCFEPFFTTKNTDQRTGLGLGGSGLGLSSAYSILKQHHGLITVSSTPGEGALFSIYLPVLGAQSQSESAATQAPAAGQIDLIGFELEEPLAKTVEPIMRSLGVRILSVDGRDQLLDQVRMYSPILRALLIDVDRSGYELLNVLRSLKREFPELLLAIVSSDARRWGRLLASLPLVEIYEKPLGIWTVHSIGRKVLSRKSPGNLSTRMTIEKDKSDEDKDETETANEATRSPRPFRGDRS